MEQQVKTKVQFSNDYNAFTNLENNDSLSTGFGKIHYDLGYLNSEDQRQESEINAIAQAGSKNICPIGTETHTSQIGFGTEYSFQMPEGAYIISFTGTMVAPIQFNVYSESGTRIALVDIHTIQEAEAGIRFVLNDNATKCKFWYDTSDNYILSNIMIRDANITDNTFQPYSPTNRQLYNLVNEKQDSLTFDGTYDSDLNPVATVSTVSNSINDLNVNSVGGAGQYISTIREAGGKIDATPTTFDTALSSSSTDGNAPTSKTVYDDQQRQDAMEAEDRAALVAQIDGGAKNFLDTSISTLKKYNTSSSAVWDGSSYTLNGITYAVNSDGTISVSGTATRTSFMVLANRTYLNTKITRGEYSISGCPTGGGSSGATYRIFCLNPNANISDGYTDTGNGHIGEFYYDDSKDCNIAIGIGSGCVITDPIVFKPMLCTASDHAISPKFVPYRPSWQELTVKEQQNENNISKLTLDGNTKTGDLNDISVNEFAVYSSSSTHLPIPGYCFVRTSINSQSPSTSRLQEAFVMSTGASYVRTMSSGNWSNWLMITPNQ